MRNQLKFGKKIVETAKWMNFGEEICRLIFRGDSHEANCIEGDMLTNKLAINLNMLCSFMKDIVMSNLNSTPIITCKCCWKILRNSHVWEQPAELDDFLSGVCKNTIFGFCTRTRYQWLFLTTPRYERVSQENTIPWMDE